MVNILVEEWFDAFDYAVDETVNVDFVTPIEAIGEPLSVCDSSVFPPMSRNLDVIALMAKTVEPNPQVVIRFHAILIGLKPIQNNTE